MYEITENKRSDLQTRGRAARQTDSGADIADLIMNNKWPAWR